MIILYVLMGFVGIKLALDMNKRGPGNHRWRK